VYERVDRHARTPRDPRGLEHDGARRQVGAPLDDGAQHRRVRADEHVIAELDRPRR
jgi:hypothetical protein